VGQGDDPGVPWRHDGSHVSIRPSAGGRRAIGSERPRTRWASCGRSGSVDVEAMSLPRAPGPAPLYCLMSPGCLVRVPGRTRGRLAEAPQQVSGRALGNSSSVTPTTSSGTKVHRRWYGPAHVPDHRRRPPGRYDMACLRGGWGTRTRLGTALERSKRMSARGSDRSRRLRSHSVAVQETALPRAVAATASNNRTSQGRRHFASSSARRSRSALNSAERARSASTSAAKT
jgi:hypothetical protein